MQTFSSMSSITIYYFYVAKYVFDLWIHFAVLLSLALGLYNVILCKVTCWKFLQQPKLPQVSSNQIILLHVGTIKQLALSCKQLLYTMTFMDFPK